MKPPLARNGLRGDHSGGLLSPNPVLRYPFPSRLRQPGAARFRPLVLGLSALALLAAGITLPAAPAGAELPPWVYGEKQRTAPLRLTLLLEQRRLRGDQVEGRARILAVVRQPAGSALQPGQRIGLRLPLPPARQPGFVGPSPVTLPERGSRVDAWLAPLADQPGWYAPAAGGYSFGPSLEKQREPGS